MDTIIIILEAILAFNAAILGYVYYRYREFKKSQDD